MLREYLESLRVQTASRAARVLGYARETALLEARHRRLDPDWGPHICATQNALLTAALEAENPRGIALIIGGGVAQDLSLSDLASCFAEVWLVDIAFSRQTLVRVRPWRGRIRCVTADLTGVLNTLWRTRKIPLASEISRSFPFDLPDKLSWIASVNCLTQLPLLPAAWLLAHGADEKDVEQFGRELMTAHIEKLSAPGVPVCLIAEMQDRRVGRRGQIVESTDYRPVLLPALEAHGARMFSQWDWLVHPYGELPNGECEMREVAAWQWNKPDTLSPNRL